MSGSGGRLRAVVDSNLFVSAAISPIGAPRRLLRAFVEQRFLLLLSEAHAAELTEVLQRPRVAGRFRIDPDELATAFAGLDAAERVIPSPSVPVHLRDPKDVKILAAALGGGADFLVTGDDDLLEHAGDPRLGRLRIVTVAEFLAFLEER